MKIQLRDGVNEASREQYMDLMKLLCEMMKINFVTEEESGRKMGDVNEWVLSLTVEKVRVRLLEVQKHNENKSTDQMTPEKYTKCACSQIHQVGVEYHYSSPNHYDGVSEYLCTVCGQRVGRWTGNVLKEGETEPRYGGR